jgi:hypothetical protein
MNKSTNSPLFLGPLALAALFVWQTSARLPAVVATHFGATGVPNGYMSHAFYLRFMLVFVVLLPWLVNFSLERILSSPNARISLPNRAHWLSDAQRSQTIDYLLRHMRYFGLLLAVFLCGAVVPALDNTRFGIVLGAYLLAMVGWIIALRRRFRRPPA